MADGVKLTSTLSEDPELSDVAPFQLEMAKALEPVMPKLDTSSMLGPALVNERVFVTVFCKATPPKLIPDDGEIARTGVLPAVFELVLAEPTP